MLGGADSSSFTANIKSIGMCVGYKNYTELDMVTCDPIAVFGASMCMMSDGRTIFVGGKRASDDTTANKLYLYTLNNRVLTKTDTGITLSWTPTFSGAVSYVVEPKQSGDTETKEFLIIFGG